MVVWLGEGAKAITKARSGPQRAELKSFAHSRFTVAVEVASADAVSADDATLARQPARTWPHPQAELTMSTINSALLGASGKVGAAKVDVEAEARKALDPERIRKQVPPPLVGGGRAAGAQLRVAHAA
jgi:hypothetical protein